MMKIILICLLSLAMCYSAPQGKEELLPAKQVEASSNVTTAANTNPAIPPAPTSENNASTQKDTAAKPNDTAIKPTNNTDKIDTTTNKTNNTDKTNANTQEKHESEVPKSDAKPQSPPLPVVTTQTTPNDSHPVPKVTVVPVVPPTNDSTTNNKNGADVKPDDGKNVKPQPTPEPVKPSEHTKEEPKVVYTRGFDGPSFIGGIILTLGLLALGFMGLRYYKAQTERNYHTL